MFFSSASPKLRNRTPPTCLKRGKRRAWQCKKNSRIPEQSICSLYQSFNCHLWSFAVTSPWAFRFLHCCSFTQIHVISSVHTSCILLWSIYQYISYDIVIISANYQVCLHQSYIRYNMTYSPYIYIYIYVIWEKVHILWYCHMISQPLQPLPPEPSNEVAAYGTESRRVAAWIHRLDEAFPSPAVRPGGRAVRPVV